MANNTIRTARKAKLQIFAKALSTSEIGSTEMSVRTNKIIKLISLAATGTICFTANRYHAISGTAEHRS